ncbi:MAG: WD40/YVTN/BNR-like repeat-containing protein, partial [Chloroflexota bacterium]
MTTVVIATPEAVLVVRQRPEWTVDAHLEGMKAQALAVDENEGRLYVGTSGNGLFRSVDGGRSWDKLAFAYDDITAVASQGGVVFAGTSPSTFWRSQDGGDSWQEMTEMVELPSASEWSFPPQPHTHHVRWIEPDPNVAGKLYVAIEAGALLRAEDGGQTWRDRVPDGPYDTHTAATHHEAEGRVYSAAGDGYYESADEGQSWSRLMDGLQHRYLVGVAVDPGNANTVVVSAARGPSVSYHANRAHAYVYRKSANEAFEPAMEGLPAAEGTVASQFATHVAQPGVFYAANNHGLFRSEDTGRSWQALP